MGVNRHQPRHLSIVQGFLAFCTRQFNPTVPPGVEHIVMRALEKEPEDRFHSAAEMQQALRQGAKELARASRSKRMPPGSEGQGQAPATKRGQYSP